jgi:hypothetical protein
MKPEYFVIIRHCVSVLEMHFQTTFGWGGGAFFYSLSNFLKWKNMQSAHEAATANVETYVPSIL